MLKTPTEYAKVLLDCYLGDHDAAMAATFDAARAHKAVSANFFLDVFLLIQDDKRCGPNGTSSQRFINQSSRPLA